MKDIDLESLFLNLDLKIYAEKCYVSTNNFNT